MGDGASPDPRPRIRRRECAAERVAKPGNKAETAGELCYRFDTLCERRKQAAEALASNSLVLNWPEFTRFACEGGSKPRAEQGDLFTEEAADES